MKKKILIYEEVFLNRSFFAYLFLASKLRQLGFEVLCCLSGVDAKYNFINYKPDIVICPSLGIDYVKFFRSIHPGVIIVNDHQEQHKLISDLKYERLDELKFADFVFLWDKKIFSNFFYKHDEINYRIVGPAKYLYSEYLSYNKDNLMTKNEFFHNYGLSFDKKTVLYALDNAIIYNSLKYERVLEALDPSRTDHYKELKKYTKIVFNWIERFNRYHGEKYQFIIKPHPGVNENLIKKEFKSNNNIHIISNEPINLLIEFSDIYLTRESTSIIDAILLNKPCYTLLMSKITKPRDKFLHIQIISKYLKNIESFNEFSNTILKNGNKKYSNIKKELKQNFNINYKKNISDFIDSINKAASLFQSPNFKKQWNLNLFMKIKISLLYKIYTILDIVFGYKKGRPRILKKIHYSKLNKYLKFDEEILP